MLHHLHFFRENLELAKEQTGSFSGVILGHSQGQKVRKHLNLGVFFSSKACQGKSISAKAWSANTSREMFGCVVNLSMMASRKMRRLSSMC